MNKPSHEYCKDCKDWNDNITNCFEICCIPIDIMKEWEKYRSIGTVEEFRTAMEKQKAKKVIKWADGTEHCPTCDCDNSCIGYGVCIDCGQKLDWN